MVINAEDANFDRFAHLIVNLRTLILVELVAGRYNSLTILRRSRFQCDVGGDARADLGTVKLSKLKAALQEGGFESNFAGHTKIYFCSGAEPALNLERAPDLGGRFPHATNPPVSLTARLQHLGIDTGAIIRNNNSQMLARVLQLELYIAGTRVAECIRKRFPTYPINLVTNNASQGHRRTFDNCAKISFFIIHFPRNL